jgi:hypothetical protein
MNRRILVVFFSLAAVVSSAFAEPVTTLPSTTIPVPDDALPPQILAKTAAVVSPPAVPGLAWEAPARPLCERAWAEGEYLLWWTRPSSPPPLISTSPAGTPIDHAGVPGTAGVAALFGGAALNDEARSGLRFTFGGWIDDEHTLGVEAQVFFLEGKTARFAASSSGSPILARPFIDATTGAAASERVAFPGDVTGGIAAADSTDGPWGFGFLFRDRLTCCPCGPCRLDLLAGYRYLHFADRIGVDEDLSSVNANNANNIAPGTRIAVSDRFGAKNDFNGFDVGLEGEIRRGRVALIVLSKMAVGYTHQSIDINGGTTVTVPGGAPVHSAGGLLALSSNIGHYSRDEVSVVPEVGVKVGYMASPHVRLTLGYSYLYWSNTVRAGDAIDLRVNPNLLPPAATPVAGPLRPAVVFQNSNWWAQGLDFGVEYRY